VGLAGLEPAASSLSEMDGRALCYPAFSQVALIHEWHRDGVNRIHPHQTGCSRLLADPDPLRGQLMSSCLGPGRGCSWSGQTSLADRALVRALVGDWDDRRRGPGAGDKKCLSATRVGHLGP
jgi:hypothetical protein